MSRLRVSLVAATLAACSRGTGVELVVTAPDTDTVELYVAPHACGDANVTACDSAVAWDTVQDKRPGTTYILDSDSLSTLAKRGGTYNLELHADPAIASIARIVAIGYQNGTPTRAGTIVDAAIPTGDLEVWKLALQPVAPVPAGDPDPTDSAPRLHVWARKDPSLAKCVVGEQRANGSTERTFLLPPGDTDCDDVPAPECDPYFYRDPGIPSVCATSRVPLPNTTQTPCRLGSQACDERVGAAVGCQPFQPSYCVPQIACSPQCTDVRSCVMTHMIPYIECTAPSDANLEDCGGGASSAPLSLSMLFDAVSGGTCAPVKFVKGFMPGVPPMFSPTLVDGTAVFSTRSYVAPCAFTISWAGIATQNPLLGLVDVPVLSAAGVPGNHVVLPIAVKFSAAADCSNPGQMTCTVVNAQALPGDPLQACTRS